MDDVRNRHRRAGHSEEDINRICNTAGKRLLMDVLYADNRKGGQADAMLYERRKATGFERPNIRLSILIASLIHRKESLDQLLAGLEHQILDMGPEGEPPLNWSVEICVDVDNGQLPIGAKRNRLLERAIGDYVCFIDDDDRVAPNYCRRILGAIESNPDCVSLTGVMMRCGKAKVEFEHKLGNPWKMYGGKLRRTPNHLNPIRRAHALAARFPDGISNGEDYVYAQSVLPFLKTEVVLDGIMYYYNALNDKTHDKRGKREPVPNEDYMKDKTKTEKKTEKKAEKKDASFTMPIPTASTVPIVQPTPPPTAYGVQKPAPVADVLANPVNPRREALIAAKAARAARLGLTLPK